MTDRVVRVRLSADASSLRRELGAAADQLDRLGRQVTITGRAATSSLNSAGGSARSMSNSFVGGIAKVAALAGTFTVVKSAFSSTIRLGMDFQSTINNLGAVANASGFQLEAVSAKARQLGNDIDLPAASASDAAQAMLELAKGGLTVQQSMDAAKGTLTLAAAAQTDGATAAMIQSAALNTFGLSADKAGHVADVLANTANAASGEISDFALGMQQGGSVAAAFGISLDDAATVLGLFANNGIRGSDAGTSFKTMLTQLNTTSKPAVAAMKELGLTVYNSKGQFVGIRTLTDQLSKAQGRLTQQQFNTAASTLFGTDAIRGANILAKEGVTGFDNLGKSVSRVGGAQDVATAQTKGLKGALGLVKNAVQDVQLSAFDTLGPSIESAVRRVAGAIPGIATVVLPVFTNIVDSVTGFFGKIGDVTSAFGADNIAALTQGGLKIKDAVFGVFHDAFSGQTLQLVSDFGSKFVGKFVDLVGVVTDGASKFISPIIEGASTLISKALPFVETFVSQVSGAVGTAVDTVAPLGAAIGDLFKSFANSGVLDTFGTALSGIGQTAQGIANLLAPITEVIGGVLKGFSALPGQVQGPLLALVGVFALSGPLGKIGLAIKSGLQTAYLNVLYGMGSIRAAMTAGVAGIAGIGKGLMAALGGPVGLAIVGITTLISFFPELISGNKDAANATENHAGAVNTLADAFQRSNGLIDENVRQTALAQLQSSKWGKSSTDLTTYAGQLSSAGVKTRDLVDGMLGIAGASDKVENAYTRQRDALQKTIDIGSQPRATQAQLEQGNAARDTLFILNEQHGAYVGLVGIQGESIAKSKENAAAVKDEAAASAAARAEATLAIVNTWPEYLKNAQDADKANRVTAGSFTKVGDAAKGIVAPVQSAAGAAEHAEKVFQNWAAHIPTVHVDLDDKGGFKSFETDATLAFREFKIQAQRAGEMADLFWFHMAGPGVTIQQSIYAAEIAMRGITAALRERDSATGAVAVAQKTLNEAQHKGVTADYDAAAKARDVAAARRDLQAAQDAQAGSASNLYNAEVDAGKAATLRVEQVYQSIAATKGDAAGRAAATKEMEKQRQAFIDARIAGDQSSMSDSEKARTLGAVTIAAGKAADKLGLIPKNVKATIQLDPHAAIQAAKEFEAKAREAAKARTAEIKAKTDDAMKKVEALRKLGIAATVDRTGNLHIVSEDAARKADDLKRRADAATAKRTAKFFGDEDDAARKADDLKRKADAAAARRTLVLGATDAATSVINSVRTALDLIHNKTVTLTVDANGTPGRVVQADGSFKSPGAMGGSATGGLIHGPGTGTSDSILWNVSDGEGVNTAAAMSHAANVRAMNFMNAGGVIPGFADGGLIGGRHINLIGHGDISRTTSSLTAIYANMDRSLKAANAAAAAAKAASVASSYTGSAGAGVEQWRGLAMKVAAAKNMDPASVQVMLNQMSRESGGDPRAINNWDINAQRGHPSVGLLQFIPDTFAANADPGFRSNIYDPESQMHAWYNYLGARYGGWSAYSQRSGDVYRAYATGGLFRGQGTGTSDSNIIRVSDNEGINTSAAMSKPANVAAMNFMNSGGVIPGFASGGLVGLPSVRNLSGVSDPSYSGNVATMLAALAQFGDVIAEAVSKVGDAVAAARDKQATYNQALNESSHLSTRASQADRTAAAARLAAARKELDAANASTASARRHAAALQATQRAEQANYRQLQTLAAHYDYLTAAQAAAQSRLDSLRSDRSSLASSVSSAVAGSDGGLLGHQDTRNTAATLLAGERYDAAQAGKYASILSQLRQKGVNGGTLSTLGAAGSDSGSVTANALLQSSKAQIAAFNETQKQIQVYSSSAGNVVAEAMYNAGIDSMQGWINGMNSRDKALQVAATKLAGTVVETFQSLLQIHSPSQVFHTFGENTVDGYVNAINRGSERAATAVANMVAVPTLSQIPPQGFVSPGSIGSAAAGRAPAPSIEISLNTSDPLVVAVAKMMDIRVDGAIVKLGQAGRKLQGQPQ